MFDDSLEIVKRLINSSSDNIAELLKSSAHSKRLLVLASLLEGRKSFPELKEITGLSKTALANHLTQMVDSFIIARIDRGFYEITKDGKELLTKIASVYHQSELYQTSQRELLEAQYSRFGRFGDIMTKTEKRVTNVGIYQPHGLSYSSAMSGAFQAIGEKWDVDDVTAFSGYGFLINTSKERICLSGPTALAAWPTIQDATEKLGWHLEHFIDEEGFPSTPPDTPLTERDEKRARDFFNKVKEAIDEYNRPVVIWGIPVPEYGIVNGYQDEYYLVSTFRTLLKQEETPIAYNKIQSPGCMEIIAFEKKTKPPTDKDHKESIVRALKMAKGEGVSMKGYAASLEAYEVLEKQLLETPDDKIDPFAFCYLVDCYFCARDSAHKYLTKLTEKYKKESFSKNLENVAETYGKITNLYKDLQMHYPLFGKQDYSHDNRKVGAEILRKIKEFEEEAINDLDECLGNWK